MQTSYSNGSTTICTINDSWVQDAPPQKSHWQVFAEAYWLYIALLFVWAITCTIWRRTGRIDTADRWYDDDGQINSQDVRDF